MATAATAPSGVTTITTATGSWWCHPDGTDPPPGAIDPPEAVTLPEPPPDMPDMGMPDIEIEPFD
jgi:hypothetical protein